MPIPVGSFPATVERVDLASTGTTQASASGGTASATGGTVVSYEARLTVQNPEGLLRPGMTATATIATQNTGRAMLVPNAALRFRPETEEEAGGGVFNPQIGLEDGKQQASIGEGSRQAGAGAASRRHAETRRGRDRPQRRAADRGHLQGAEAGHEGRHRDQGCGPVTAEPLIQLEGITKTFGSGAAAFQALKGIDLTIERGEFVAIMGPSGSGKSTTMNILGCLDVPTGGIFRFRGVEVQKLDRDQRSLLRRRYLGFVFQGFNLLARTTALENVELPLLYRGENKTQRRESALRALDQVGLVPWASHTPAELSGGQQQRVAIARALVTQPDVLLADEPTGNLDSERSVEIMQLLQRLNGEGITVLMVTHEEEMAAYAKTIVRFRDGLVERIDRSARAVEGSPA